MFYIETEINLQPKEIKKQRNMEKTKQIAQG